MPVVRYVALTALVVWLGGTIAALEGDLTRHLTLVSSICGGAILAGLFVMKFVGPPPHAFVLRVVLAAAMLAVALLARWRGQSTMTLAATAVIGLVLLAWYARE